MARDFASDSLNVLRIWIYPVLTETLEKTVRIETIDQVNRHGENRSIAEIPLKKPALLIETRTKKKKKYLAKSPFGITVRY